MRRDFVGILSRKWWLMCFVTALIAACEPAPTPFPVDVPVTPTATLSPTEIPPINYGLAPNTNGLIAELDTIQTNVNLTQATEDISASEPGSVFDIVAGYGEYAGWSRSEILPRVMLVIHPTLQPMTPEYAAIIRQRIYAEGIVTAINIPGTTILQSVSTPDIPSLRQSLANQGRPDGLRVAVAHAYVPGVDTVVAQLASINVEARVVKLTNDEIRVGFENGDIHMALVTWTSEEEQQRWHDLFGQEFTMDLFTLPISYSAVDGLTISLTAGGWPLPRRS